MGFLDQLKKQPLPIDRGGTGAYTAESARENLGITSGGSSKSAYGGGTGNPDNNRFYNPNAQYNHSGLAVLDEGTEAVIPFPGNLKGAWVKGNTNSDGADGIIIVVNGVATALSAMAANGSAVGSDTTNVIPVVAGDTVCVKVQNSAWSAIAWGFYLEG